MRPFYEAFVEAIRFMSMVDRGGSLQMLDSNRLRAHLLEKFTQAMDFGAYLPVGSAQIYVSDQTLRELENAVMAAGAQVSQAVNNAASSKFTMAGATFVGAGRYFFIEQLYQTMSAAKLGDTYAEIMTARNPDDTVTLRVAMSLSHLGYAGAEKAVVSERIPMPTMWSGSSELADQITTKMLLLMGR